MGLFQWQIFKSGIFKSTGYLLSTPKRVLPCVFISEDGSISLDRLPLATAYCYSDVRKVAWAVIQKLKMPLEGFDTDVLLISEKSYYPLDPLGRLSEDEKTKIEPLTHIAKSIHAEVKSRVADNARKSQNNELLKTMFYILGVVVVIVLIIYFIKK